MALNWDDPQVLCEWARDLGRTHTFLDFHVHPFDVLSDDTRYTRDAQVDGLYSRGLFKYRPPVLEAASEDLTDVGQPASDNQRAFILSSRFTYNHTGPKVFNDQLDLVGLSGALLLPVARTAGKAGEMSEVVGEMFQKDRRFLPGCALPVGLQPEELAGFFKSARERFGVRAIKFHPNLAAIDPGTQGGQELIYSTLSAAGDLHLPIIVHAGRTPSIEPAASREYGTISHLTTINWSLSAAPVILAHAACYGLTVEEAPEALSRLDDMLERHSNLRVDTSNLEPSILGLVLNRIPPERLIFGSDALYVPIWKAWLRFLQALRRVSVHPDDDLIRIAALNPAQCMALENRSRSLSLKPTQNND